MLLDQLLLSRAAVERGAHLRSDAQWLAQQLTSPATKVLLLQGGKFPVVDQRIQWLSVDVLEEHEVHEHYLLGVKDDVAYIAARVANEVTDGATLFDTGSVLDAHDVGLATTAVALGHWHENHQYCAKCGSKLSVTSAGWSRTCPLDGTEVFPRTDPAVIALPIHNDKALLGRRFNWPENRFSCFAGFVEAGESSEMALQRELVEECGLIVDPVQIRYMGSQPWPFPQSLMLGYHVGVLNDDAVADGEEITTVRWFSQEELVAEVTAGNVVLPPKISIARQLIENWVGHSFADTTVWRR